MFSRCLVSQVKHNSYFLIGLLIGLWVSLAVIPLDEEPAPCVATVGSASPVQDEFVPQREEKPAGSGQTAGRSVQRPRYYSTELGMRGGLIHNLNNFLTRKSVLKILFLFKKSPAYQGVLLLDFCQSYTYKKYLPYPCFLLVNTIPHTSIYLSLHLLK